MRLLERMISWGALAALLALPAAQAAATPLGTSYDVLLVATLPDGHFEGFDSATTGDSPTFDDQGDIVSPGFDTGAGNAPGGLLEVEESAEDLGTQEQIKIWMYGFDGVEFGPIFQNAISASDPVLFGVTGLYWLEGAADIDDIEVLASFASTPEGVSIGFDPAVLNGDGSQGSPFDLLLLLNPEDLVEPTGAPATDLHLHLLVSHRSAPEPARFALFAPLIALGVRRLRRR
jgi:hypothetical protein